MGDGLGMAFLMGAAFVFGIVLGLTHISKTEKEANIVIEECQKDLPRNEFCVLTAVPKEDK